ncbi:hypothetical protein D3C81_1238780 [compost metagenome]
MVAAIRQLLTACCQLLTAPSKLFLSCCYLLTALGHGLACCKQFLNRRVFTESRVGLDQLIQTLGNAFGALSYLGAAIG